MKPIERIAILGAGALGAMYAAHFINGRFDVSFVASGARAERLKRDGITVNGAHYPVSVIQPGDITPPADLAIVAVKDHQLAAALDDFGVVVGEHTTVLSVMNGLDSEDTLSAAYDADNVLYCVALGMDPYRENGEVKFSNPGKLLFGEAVNEPVSQRVQVIAQALERARLAHDTPADMLRAMWWKFMINVGINQASAVLGARYGVMQTSPDAQALMEALMREVIALAQAADVNLSEGDITAWYQILHGLLPDSRTSMLQDVEAGRKTEVEMFAGKVVRLGQQYNVPTPINETVLRILRVRETVLNLI